MLEADFCLSTRDHGADSLAIDSPALPQHLVGDSEALKQLGGEIAPLTLAEYAMDFACRSVRFSASTELMSGLGAPARTAMPMAERASATRLSASILPSLINSPSASSASMTTSTGSPRRADSGWSLTQSPWTSRRSQLCL